MHTAVTFDISDAEISYFNIFKLKCQITRPKLTTYNRLSILAIGFCPKKEQIGQIPAFFWHNDYVRQRDNPLDRINPSNPIFLNGETRRKQSATFAAVHEY